MKIYLDNCCLQRPLDDKSQIRIQLESDAILAVLSLCESGQADLVSSEVLEFELNRNPNLQSKAYVNEVLAIAKVVVQVNHVITQRAQELTSHGFKGVDALHLAVAEMEKVDYFCSCDDRLLNRARNLQMLQIEVVSPLELAEEMIK
jgi:predicted nucleic acid-binding protein